MNETKDLTQKAYSDTIEDVRTIDYTAFKGGGELIEACKDSGLAWATAMHQYLMKYNNIHVPIDILFVWAANMIESSHDYRTSIPKDV